MLLRKINIKGTKMTIKWPMGHIAQKASATVYLACLMLGYTLLSVGDLGQGYQPGFFSPFLFFLIKRFRELELFLFSYFIII